MLYGRTDWIVFIFRLELLGLRSREFSRSMSKLNMDQRESYGLYSTFST